MNETIQEPIMLEAPEIKSSSDPSKPSVDAYYDVKTKEFLLKNEGGRWFGHNENQFKRVLRSLGYSTRFEASSISEADSVILEILNTKDVHFSGPLAGYKEGFYVANGTRFLVTSEPKIITPIEGAWPTINQLISGLLESTEEGIDQRHYFYGWLKVAYESLVAGEPRAGQALVIAGERGCGKSLCQAIITEILGGRSAKPHAYMCGTTAFNSDLFGAEHLMLEDEQASTDIRARRNMGAHIKSITVNPTQRLHAKGRDALVVKPFWRLSISLNSEPENLMVLPPIDDSLRDKLILLRGYKKPMPMPTATNEERRAFMTALESEYPAFVHFLVNYDIPPDLQCQRFGVTHYHHPEILEAVDSLSPEMRLLSLVDGELFSSGTAETWKGTAEELERRLTRPDSQCAHEASRILHYHTACGTYLGRLAGCKPERIEQQRTAKKRLWRIKPPDDPDPEE
ncbi:MAG: hypothetical protein JNN07_18495 [Verrucomicrobiales bacterium]|nr:hypothetical protein [Verrucomicrobiales bacterium]